MYIEKKKSNFTFIYILRYHTFIKAIFLVCLISKSYHIKFKFLRSALWVVYCDYKMHVTNVYIDRLVSCRYIYIYILWTFYFKLAFLAVFPSSLSTLTFYCTMTKLLYKNCIVWLIVGIYIIIYYSGPSHSLFETSIPLSIPVPFLYTLYNWT